MTPPLKGLLKGLLLAGMITIGTTACEKTAELTPKQLAEQNKPGTVMIEAIHQAEIAVPDYVTNDAKSEELIQAVGQAVAQGELAPEDAFEVVITQMLENPLEYFQPTDQIIRKSAEVTSTGSGAIVTADGYVITNAHVVASDGDDLKQALAESALRDVVIEGCEAELNQSDELRSIVGQKMGTEEFMQLCQEGLVQYFANYMQLSQVETKIYTAVGAVTPDEGIAETGYVSEVKEIGSAVPGKDVAVLKVSADNLPTVTIGDDTSLEAGDPIYVLGYPADAVLSSNQVNEASLTAGVVSARKKMPDDWEVLQTDAAMNPGNSGGPVFNDKGEVIGIATFGAVDSETGTAVQGVNFVVPMSVVQEFLNESNVQPLMSSLSEQYQKGIALFEQEKYKQALSIFRDISALNPQFPYVQSYVSKAQSHIAAGDDRSLPVWVYFVIPGVLLTAAGGLVYWKRQHRGYVVMHSIEPVSRQVVNITPQLKKHQ